ncbi:MAG: helix-turn-helix domain-containing protein [Myxococcales bacterium]|nr:helix-turn-helix domain-containing protein [Myxococcales bacterium]
MEVPHQALPPPACALEHLAQGHAVTVTPYNAEVTPRQAAELLGVSRPYVMKLLHQGTLAHRRVGAHHRIPLEDVVGHRAMMQNATANALDAMARLDQDADHRGETISGYDD